MVLFKCSTLYMLLNAINIKLSLYKDLDADILIGNATDFTGITEKIIESGIFKNVYSMTEYNKNRDYRPLTHSQKHRICKNPELFLDDIPQMHNKYERMLIGVDDEFHKLLYYCLVNRGMNLKVDIFEEGLASHVLDVEERTLTDRIDHARYGKKAFFKNVERLYFYEPDLFKAPLHHFEMIQIPKLDPNNTEIRDALNFVFSYTSLPPEKYIFFEEAFYHDRILCNDMDLFEEIAGIVGKDNIVVKLHPRSKVDRFSHRGYKVVETQHYPFEICLLNEDVSRSVFITVTSTAALSGKLILDKDVNTILLKNIFNGRTLVLTRKDTAEFFNSLIDMINEKQRYVFTPGTMDAFSETIKYISGRMD